MFWPKLGNILLKLMIFYRSKGNLGKALVHGIITGVSRGSKVGNEQKNWPLITLLNSICKY